MPEKERQTREQMTTTQNLFGKRPVEGSSLVQETRELATTYRLSNYGIERERHKRTEFLFWETVVRDSYGNRCLVCERTLGNP